MYSDLLFNVLIRYERLTASQLRQKYPHIEVSDDYEALYQEHGGLVDAALGNSVHVQLACAHGATVIERCPVLRLEATSDGHAKVCYNLNDFCFVFCVKQDK